MTLFGDCRLYSHHSCFYLDVVLRFVFLGISQNFILKPIKVVLL